MEMGGYYIKQGCVGLIFLTMGKNPQKGGDSLCLLYAVLKGLVRMDEKLLGLNRMCVRNPNPLRVNANLA